MKTFLFLLTLFIILPSSLLATKDQVFLEQICHEVAPSEKYSSCMLFVQNIVSSIEPTSISDDASKAMNELMDFINQAIANLQDYLKLGNLTDQIREGLESCSGNFQNMKNDVHAAINDVMSGSNKEAVDQLKQVIDEARNCDDKLSNIGLNMRRLRTTWTIGKLVAKIIVRIIKITN